LPIVQLTTRDIPAWSVQPGCNDKLPKQPAVRERKWTRPEKRVSNGDYRVRSDDYGSFTWLYNNPFFRIAEPRGWLKSS